MSGSMKGYPAELRERAVRMVGEVRHEHSSEWAAVESVAGKFRAPDIAMAVRSPVGG
jgi:hypothetical protein